MISAGIFGVSVYSGTGAVIQGNFIGTNAAGGGLGLGNDTGVSALTAATVGGDTPQSRNVISGNTRYGVALDRGGTIKGNFIGTNSAGSQAVPNLRGGILRNDFYDSSLPLYILENVISGNATSAVKIDGSANVTMLGNLIGTGADGVSPIPNYTSTDGPGIGVLLLNGAHDNIIGSPLPGEPNVIAFNSTDGVRVQGTGTNLDFIRGNSIHDNGAFGINNVSGGNIELLPPVITQVSAGSVSGTACVFPCVVDVFADADDEGKVYLGTAAADNGGLWTLNATVPGPNVTATDSDPTIGTSEFSAPVAAPVLTQGDVDCSGVVSSVDALKLLRHSVGLAVSQTQPCPSIGDPVGAHPFGDVDCSSVVNSADALKVLRYAAGLSVSQSQPCTAMGKPLGS